MRNVLLCSLFLVGSFNVQADVAPCFVADNAASYDAFSQSIASWVDASSGAEKVRRELIVAGLNQVMSSHNFRSKGTTFSQFQRYLQSPYRPNLRDIYYVLCDASKAAVWESDVAAICNAAGIAPIPSDSLDLILSGLLDKINGGELSQLSTQLFQSEVNWLLGKDSSAITLENALQKIEADPARDCDSILRNLDPAGIAALESLVSAAVPGWTLPTLDYASFDKNLTAWIHYRYTDAASNAVASQEIVTQILDTMYGDFAGQVPFSEFQQELLKTDSVWTGSMLYFTLSKVGQPGGANNLPVPTDALQAIFRCAGLDILACQPQAIDRIYTSLLSHQNGGTAGSGLALLDVVGYGKIINYIHSHKKTTVPEIIAYIEGVSESLSSYAQQDLYAIIDPQHYERPYYYTEDTQYFRNDQKLLPKHKKDPHYYREQVIPSLGVGRYEDTDSAGRYRYVTGKGGELYFTVHYNQFVRVDPLMLAYQKTGEITADELSVWISDSTNPSSPFYDSKFYKNVQDLAQIAGVPTLDLINLNELDPDRAAQVLAQVNAVFAIISINPAPPI